MDLDTFRSTLQAPAPPGGWSPALRGVWHALRGEWDAAHDAVQADDRDCAWVHAALHRQEGDDANAGYWYRHAGRRAGAGAPEQEFAEIAAALLAAAAH